MRLRGCRSRRLLLGEIRIRLCDEAIGFRRAGHASGGDCDPWRRFQTPDVAGAGSSPPKKPLLSNNPAQHQVCWTTPFTSDRSIFGDVMRPCWTMRLRSLSPTSRRSFREFLWLPLRQSAPIWPGGQAQRGDDRWRGRSRRFVRSRLARRSTAMRVPNSPHNKS